MKETHHLIRELRLFKCETCEESARAARNLSPDLKFEQHFSTPGGVR